MVRLKLRRSSTTRYLIKRLMYYNSSVRCPKNESFPAFERVHCLTTRQLVPHAAIYKRASKLFHLIKRFMWRLVPSQGCSFFGRAYMLLDILTRDPCPR